MIHLRCPGTENGNPSSDLESVNVKLLSRVEMPVKRSWCVPRADSTDPVVRQWVGFDFSPSGRFRRVGETVDPLKQTVSKGHSFSCEFLCAGS
jgi:hypothetical protein